MRFGRTHNQRNVIAVIMLQQRTRAQSHERFYLTH
jgi:hypothetical protein